MKKSRSWSSQGCHGLWWRLQEGGTPSIMCCFCIPVQHRVVLPRNARRCRRQRLHGCNRWRWARNYRCVVLRFFWKIKHVQYHTAPKRQRHFLVNDNVKAIVVLWNLGCMWSVTLCLRRREPPTKLNFLQDGRLHPARMCALPTFQQQQQKNYRTCS